MLPTVVYMKIVFVDGYKQSIGLFILSFSWDIFTSLHEATEF